ncbi:MAG: hypothetical protein OXG72_21105 [Acidobacteria bacterium]|nr:hypothetical protein [Acidobacteriota bacterium]
MRTTPRAWKIFVHGRENGSEPPFATVPDAASADDALDQVKTELNGSPEAYDRDALAPALVAVPTDGSAGNAAEEHTGPR